MHDWALRFKVEAFEVQDTAVAGRHQNGNPADAGGLTYQKLHIKRVALLNDQVETVEEAVQVLTLDAVREDDDSQVWVGLANLARGHHRLVQSEIEDTSS